MRPYDLSVGEAKEFLGFILSRCKGPVRLTSPTAMAYTYGSWRRRAQVVALRWRKRYPELFAAWVAARRLRGESIGWVQ